MAELPFDADSDEDRPFTVSELGEAVRAALTEAMPRKVRVVGEISNFSDRTHWFFSLKDEHARIGCVCFARVARRVSFPVQEGLEVVATGRVDYWPTGGRLQLYVDRLEPVGMGALELKFRALCDELRRAGYFDEARKKTLPAMPRRVAVVTSREGAALQDVLNTAARRWAGCELMVLDVRVQGASAAPAIAEAIRALSAQGPRLGIDAVLLTRGGGSLEDLWAFNERAVADALSQCALPVVAAVGHESDTTVAELVADLRCATPTQAVMRLLPDRQALAQQVEQLGRRLHLLTRQHVQRQRQRLRAAERHPCFRRAGAMLEPLRQRVEQGAARLHRAQRDGARRRRERLEGAARQLEAVGPMNVLKRGYSATLNADGRALTAPAQARPGERLTSVLAGGRLHSTAEGAAENGRRKAPRRARKEGAGPTLFDPPAPSDDGAGKAGE
jgi:exodeoxyribonuclease VII large subunit